jgi:filamentous hemagglutinin
LDLTATGKVSVNGQSLAGGELNVSGSRVDLDHAELSGTGVSLTATAGDLNASRAQISAKKILTAVAAQTLRTDGAVLSADQLNLTAASLSNQAGELLQTGTGDLAIALTAPGGVLNNTRGRIATNSHRLALSAASILNDGGEIVHAGLGALAIDTQTFSSRAGHTLSQGGLVLDANDVLQDQGAMSAHQLTVRASNISNRGGSIVQTGVGEASITAAGAIDNSAGQIAGNGKWWQVELDGSESGQQGRLGPSQGRCRPAPYRRGPRQQRWRRHRGRRRSHAQCFFSEQQRRRQRRGGARFGGDNSRAKQPRRAHVGWRRA